MKINDTNVGGAAAAKTQRQQDIQQTDRSNAGRSSGAGGDSNDRVELSGSLGRLSHVLSSFQSDRASRVESLAAQYQQGNYQPDAAAASRGIVSEALSAGLR